MKLLDAHRRRKAQEEQEARLAALALERETEHQAMRDERQALVEALAQAINRGYVEIALGATARPMQTVCVGPLGGESNRLYINIGDRTYIVNVYAHGVMAP